MLRKRESRNNAEGERLPDAWRMTKVEGDHILAAVCEVWAVEMGWDLRLQIYGRGLQMASLCRSGREVVDRADEWKAAMVEKGWELTPRRDALGVHLAESLPPRHSHCLLAPMGAGSGPPGHREIAGSSLPFRA
jgi:hypothetical protein